MSKLTLAVWRYRADITNVNQPTPKTFFRGYVYWYKGGTRITKSCQNVHTNRADALKEARVLRKLIEK